MKGNKNIQSFEEFNENFNISSVSKEQLKHFLDYVRKNYISTIPMNNIEKYVDDYIKSIKNNDFLLNL